MRDFLGSARHGTAAVVWHSFPVTIWRDFPGASTVARVEPAAVTVGNFDGVHRGHQHVIERTRELSRGLPVIAVTFEPHPLAVVAPDHAPKRLATTERRVELLHAAGADEIRILDFTRAMAAWTPQEFVDRVLRDELRASLVAVGENFRFGHRAQGDTTFLRRAGEQAGFTVDALDLDGGTEPYSSTLVRAHVAAGRMREAADVLGRPHEVSGIVRKGDQRGRDLGYPTANVPVDEAYAVPPDGVYAGWLVRDGGTGERLPAAISVGTNPTFDGVERRVESYVLDRTDLDLYGEAIRVEFVDLLRGMEKFDGIDDLIVQMADDVVRTRSALGL
ncbi:MULTISPECIES: bifunctional riboflavin kinase/FAD synthetase [Aeromicrobium]|uniref:bifunctional riboflavin kinase/FAD synthetase n=1 Tax=Aeromicrobium TaxID=2040 RepID=UPI0009E9971F|nr:MULTISPECIES: bifunctional riboflavin kinase/FAD synthetase [Aeromicrobium]MBD8605941.1 bifunctional riboflavin kinase/FAD synthetase [Aeromicrobium sp. CFBP 8757]MCL8252148.1 bifunctional riboflavin kinase/FAD synthetase [Aeromicrobium fastidiosum]